MSAQAEEPESARSAPAGLGPTRSGPLVALHDVSVRHGDAPAEQALLEATIVIERGERVALLGPSGAGKSTVIDVMGGRRRPSSGRAHIDGIDLAETTGRTARVTRARIGMVAQRSELVPSLSVHRNVLLGRSGRQRSATTLWRLLRNADAGGVGASLESVGIADLADRTTSSLSGGQRQRVSIARVHYQSPDLVLADEPVSNLDPVRSNAVLELLTGLVIGCPQRSLVVALHDPDLARRHCDRIIGLDRGVVSFDLPTAEVTDELIDSLYTAPPKGRDPDHVNASADWR